MKKVRTKGDKAGRCNICGALGKLTEDHVPPKGSINPRKVGIRSLVQTVEPVDPKIVQFSQNGVKFRSLCAKCNNHRLGKKFDPALNQFSRKVAQLLTNHSRLILPSRVDIELQPQRIARAVIGHLLAAEIREDMSSSLISAPMRELMRQYFLDISADFPTELNLYFWTYPAKRQVILKGVGVGLFSTNQVIVGDFLKYFPIAFWLTHKAPQRVKESMQDREMPIRGSGVDDYRTVAIRTDKQDTFRSNWPEVPDDYEMLLVNDDLCFIADAT